MSEFRATHPEPTFDCPRRGDMRLWGRSSQDWADYIDKILDPASDPDDYPAPLDGWREDGTCSCCGGMSPERLFEAIAFGAELGPTDKNYKVYVEGGERIEGGVRKQFGGKFYTVHLNRENAARLRELITGGKVAIGYPGHFYNGLWLAPPKPGLVDIDLHTGSAHATPIVLDDEDPHGVLDGLREYLIPAARFLALHDPAGVFYCAVPERPARRGR